MEESDVSVYLGELFECEFDGFCFFGIEPSVFLYIAYFVELCFLAIFFAFGGNFAGLFCGFFFLAFGRIHTFQKMKTFSLKVFYPE